MTFSFLFMLHSVFSAPFSFFHLDQKIYADIKFLKTFPLNESMNLKLFLRAKTCGIFHLKNLFMTTSKIRKTDCHVCRFIFVFTKFHILSPICTILERFDSLCKISIFLFFLWFEFSRNCGKNVEKCVRSLENSKQSILTSLEEMQFVT